MPECKIHNVGFYSPEPSAIYSIALNRRENKLAIARSNASLEIWNLTHIPFIEKTFPCDLENFTIEGLCWSQNRLFSVGLHGFLVEYDLYSIGFKNKWAVTGEAATCIDAVGDHIAIGTERGYVNIYEVTEEGAEFKKFLDKQEGRILCLKYNKTGEFVVAGSINAIRIWNVKSGHAIHKMVLGRSEAKKDTIVWCLEVLNDFTIFSGDSRGVVTLWDGKLGAQIESYQSHKADITAICLDENEESMYSAGVDPLISNYQKVKVGSNVKWVKSIQRKIHEHDVRAMVFNKGRLYSAGIDSYLVCSYHPPKTLVKYAPVLQSPCVYVAPSDKSGENRFILLRHSKHVELWSLSQCEKVNPNYRGIVKPLTKPKKLVVIQKLGKNWNEEDEPEGVSCACISANGNYIFVGTISGFRLYAFTYKKEKPNLSKIDDLDDSNIPCVQAVFNNKTNQLIVALNSGTIVVYDMDNSDPFISQRIERNRAHFSDTITHLVVSNCGKYLVAADVRSNIVVYTFDADDGYSFLLKLPRCDIGVTALNFSLDSSCVLVAYADNKIQEYNIKMQRFTTLCDQLESSPSWKLRSHPIRNIAFDSRDKNLILVHDDSNIVVIRKNHIIVDNPPSGKVARKNNKPLINGDCGNGDSLNITTIQKYKHLVHLSTLSENELVAVEVNPLSILEKLPPAFAQKSFGAK
ncbi:U3 small nucleolar RNA-associated protein 4 homolog [Anthonomus grandis grandis]|uniref:U3 small nucleolar RNA-associated protein 4 homolog n=1 Tax=Anthonomus grandis grandis TaxID=2921223 RepID=UPI0021650FA9|nr:U3 small nucleolar RNA-associated protein 4 homolog [Anthonomus grandis grandis]